MSSSRTQSPRAYSCGLWRPRTVDYISFSQQNPCVQVSVSPAPMGQKPLRPLMSTTSVRPVELHSQSVFLSEGWASPICHQNPSAICFNVLFLFCLSRSQLEWWVGFAWMNEWMNERLNEENEWKQHWTRQALNNSHSSCFFLSLRCHSIPWSQTSLISGSMVSADAALWLLQTAVNIAAGIAWQKTEIALASAHSWLWVTALSCLLAAAEMDDCGSLRASGGSEI